MTASPHGTTPASRISLAAKRAVLQQRGDLPTDAERDYPNVDPEVELFVKQFAHPQDCLTLSPGGSPNQRTHVRHIGEDVVRPHQYAIYRNSELVERTGKPASTVSREISNLQDRYVLTRQPGLLDGRPTIRPLPNVMRFLYEWTTNPTRLPPVSEDVGWTLLLAAMELYTGTDIVGCNWELFLYRWVGPVVSSHDASVALRNDGCGAWEVVIEAGDLREADRDHVERGIDHLSTEILATGCYLPDQEPAYDPDRLPDERSRRIDPARHSQSYCDCNGVCWHYEIPAP